jgi:hypothetical protein
MNMKLHLLAPLLAAAAVAHAQQSAFNPQDSASSSAHTEQVKYTLLKPQDKTSETVKEGERNPYSKGEAQLVSEEQKGTNEENQIRDRLVKLRVVGASPGPEGLRVMLGDMVLEPGKFVPQVLPEQTVMLRVGSITPQSIELIWVEKKPSGLPARTMVIPVDLRPSVRTLLKGQPTEKNQWGKDGGGKSDAPITLLFPEVAQTAGSSPAQMAHNTAAPRVTSVSTSADAPKPDSQEPAPKPDPQWEKAMDLLDEIMPKQDAAP